MKLTVFTLSLMFSLSSFALPAHVKCLKTAKKAGLSLEQAYQSCAVSESQSKKKK